jgi:hypothetical protein
MNNVEVKECKNVNEYWREVYRGSRFSIETDLDGGQEIVFDN